MSKELGTNKQKSMGNKPKTKISIGATGNPMTPMGQPTGGNQAQIGKDGIGSIKQKYAEVKTASPKTFAQPMNNISQLLQNEGLGIRTKTAPKGKD